MSRSSRARILASLNAYGVDLRAALDLAAEQGYRLVEASVLSPDFDPRTFGQSARRHLRKYLEDLGLRLDVVAAGFPGAGLADPTRADERLTRLREMLTLAADLRVGRAVVTLGGFDDVQTQSLARSMLSAVADLSDRAGVETAILDPFSDASKSAERVAQLGCPTMRVAADASGLIELPTVAAAALLSSAYLRDVRRTPGGFQETPMGQGEVDFRGLLARLDAGGADPSLIVRSEQPAPVDALRIGREYIASLADRGGDR